MTDYDILVDSVLLFVVLIVLGTIAATVGALIGTGVEAIVKASRRGRD